jgi:hypothetical protein
MPFTLGLGSAYPPPCVDLVDCAVGAGINCKAVQLRCHCLDFHLLPVEADEGEAVVAFVAPNRDSVECYHCEPFLTQVDTQSNFCIVLGDTHHA